MARLPQIRSVRWGGLRELRAVPGEPGGCSVPPVAVGERRAAAGQASRERLPSPPDKDARCGDGASRIGRLECPSRAHAKGAAFLRRGHGPYAFAPLGGSGRPRHPAALRPRMGCGRGARIGPAPFVGRPIPGGGKGRWRRRRRPTPAGGTGRLHARDSATALGAGRRVACRVATACAPGRLFGRGGRGRSQAAGRSAPGFGFGPRSRCSLPGSAPALPALARPKLLVELYLICSRTS